MRTSGPLVLPACWTSWISTVNGAVDAPAKVRATATPEV